MGSINAKIDAVFADMDTPQHPGAGLLVIDHNEVVYKKCYGLADIEAGRPVTADTSFYLGSISKQFTAMAILLLAEQGRLGFEDRLSAFFPQLPSWSAEISLFHLLHHTSGLPGYVQFFSSSAGVFEWAREINGVTNEAVLERAIELAGPEFPVGTQYAYSGMGYVLLAMIVAVVSGIDHITVAGLRKGARDVFPGTFRTWRDVRLESVMRAKADIDYAKLSAPFCVNFTWAPDGCTANQPSLHRART